MKIRILVICLFYSFVTNAQDNVSLFNGKDLSGWKIHGTEKWFVENGALVCESGQINNMVISLQIKLIKILS